MFNNLIELLESLEGNTKNKENAENKVITDKYSLYQGDCLEIMKKIPDKSVDMVLCDLPFGITKNSWDLEIPLEDYVVVGEKKLNKNDYYMLNSLNGMTKKEIDLLWKINKIDGLWSHYDRIVKDNGAILLFGQDKFTAKLVMSNMKYHRYNLVWDKVLKSGFLNANKMPLKQHEDICVLYKKSPIYNPQKFEGEKPCNSSGTRLASEYKNNNYGAFENIDNTKKHGKMKYPTTVLKFEKPHSSVSVHPTQKSTQLLEWLIKTYTDEGMTIMDNTMGSGSCGVASMNTNRKFIGIEIQNDYFDIAKERIEKAYKENENKK